MPSSRRPSPRYSRMFSAFACGLSLFVAGVIGFDISRMHGFFRGGRWADGPIFWQILLGAGLVLLGVYWSRRLGEPSPPDTPRPDNASIKNVGSGKTADAASHTSDRH